ncbi:hypothetical protein [Mycoplasma bradburyae]|uniref:Uncharacterized protein n=1 Tax=Mycoplasma bradburyae TaxID=2963128 RepID=A0ABT5GBX6_9MOLU|nr:hypothetical protein [Mycoplasma bradburyae]MDC4182242.1 hypothetical protein [Mycoplasma bradburyae]UTS70065.1 hypothetical protein NMG68_03515 [Mycoplasma bradburyae]
MYKIFYEFFFIKDNSCHSISEVQHEYKIKNGDISYFRGRMFCPECKIAGLSFTHKTSRKREYLSKLPSSNHEEGCSYSYIYEKTDQIKDFLKGYSEKKISDKLEARLNTLLNIRIDNEKLNETYVTGLNHEHSFIDIFNKEKRKYIRIPTKSINRPLKPEDNEKEFIFYGTVKLDVEKVIPKNNKTSKDIKSNNNVFYNLILKTQKANNEWKYKTKVWRFINKDDIDINAKYDIAILGKYTTNYNGTIKPIYQNFVKYRKLETD